jgi:hemerythrin-like metal-binding protein
MSTLVWSDALSLSMPVMDATHHEFVDLLARVEASDDASLPFHWQALVEHTEDHFAREDQWMRDTGFAPNNCHSTQHTVVLDVLREAARRAAAGDLAQVRLVAHELAIWFPQHAQSMDFGLALHLKSMGYDPESGQLAHPDRQPAQAITGCGGQCGTDARTSPPSEAANAVA